MKKYNNILTNKITKLAFLFSVFLCFSCKNVLQNQDNFQSIPKGKAYLVINAGDITARTIKPDSDESLLNQFKSFTLTGTGLDSNGKKFTLNVSATDIKDLYKKQILLDAGTWTFTLTASLSSNFSATVSDVSIEEGKANSVSFNLQPNENYGYLSVKIDIGKKKDIISKVNITLTKLADEDDTNDEVIETKSITQSYLVWNSTNGTYYVSYEKVSSSSKLEAGEYRLVFDFYSTDNEKPDSFPYIVHIAAGTKTSFEQTVDLNDVFTITYKGTSDSPTSYIADGQTLVTKYSRKSEDIILPRYNRQDRLFKGWYDEDGNIITKISHNANRNYTLTCQWELLKSGDPVTIYVNPEAEAHYGFSEEYGLESLEAAMETIERANCYIQNHDWIIKIKGEISGSHVISTDVNNVKEHVKSITLEGATQAVAGQTEPQDCLKGGITTATENGAVLSVQIPVPVIIKNLKITGGNNTNTGDIKGGGIYVGGGSTVILDDDALITGNSSTEGSGVYVSNNATLQMGGTAQVTNDNDVYLTNGTKILITNQFDGTISHAATITPELYSVENQVLDIASNGSGALENECSVFKVTPQIEGDVTTNWEIDTEGKLQIASNGGNSNPDDLVYLSGTNGEELTSGTYWDAEGTSTVGNLYVSKTEITQSEYEKYMTYETGYSPADTDEKSTYPAYYVSWCEAIIYCNLRSIDEGLSPYYSMDGETDPTKWTAAGVETSNGKCYLPVANITISNYDTPGNNGMWEPTYVNGGGHLKFAERTTDEGHYGYRLPCGAEWCYIAANSSSLEITDLTTKNVDEWVQAWDEMLDSVGHYHVSGNINGTYNDDYNFSIYDAGGSAIPYYAHESTANIGFRVVRNVE